MSIELIDKIKPKNNGNFALIDAVDVEMPDGTRLSEFNLETGSGLPEVSEEDNGKIFSVVNGELILVPVADSAVKEYIDEYISSALEGDY